MPNSDPQQFAQEAFCYLTTTGRVTGRPHTIEIWFALDRRTLYMLSGGRDNADWVKNILRQPQAMVRLRDVVYPGRARVVEEGGDEDALARRIVVDKYQPGYGEDLSGWGRESLVVAVDL
jgi:deazaflavin-dependent oxidoreductase (nitroreductase family)